MLSLSNMKAFFLYILLAFLCRVAYGQECRLVSPSESYAVDYPAYLEDRDAAFSFEQIQKMNDRFTRPANKIPDFKGNMAKAIWYRFEVLNGSSDDNWYLEIKGGFMHRITVYEAGADSVAHSLALNADSRFAERPVRSNNLIFPVLIAQGSTKTIYVRATTKTLIRTSMSFSTMQTLYEKSIFVSYADGFFTAVAVALLLYNLFVYFTLKEKAYLYYIGYISTSIIHTNLVSGHIQAFLPWFDWLNTTTILPFVSFFSILFTNSFLRTRQYAPFIYQVRCILMSGCAVPLICYMAGWYGSAIQLVSALVFILFMYWIAAGIIAYRKGFSSAIFYLIGFGAFAVMSVIFEMKMQGVLPENYWTDSSLFIGGAIEAIVLSFALASKINFYKKEKELIQEQAYQQAVNFSRELINMQEAERKRIASELHDSLGQKLILIKNKILKAAKPGAAEPAGMDNTLPASVAEAIQEIRTISYGLRPYQIDLLGLTSSINSLVEESLDAAGVNCATAIDNIDNLFDSDAGINIYRIMQECINNIVKHAAASHADVSIKRKEAGIAIVIKDNGSGFDTSRNYSGFGLKGITERLHILKGTVAVSSVQPLGTSFRFYIPFQTISK